MWDCLVVENLGKLGFVGMVIPVLFPITSLKVKKKKTQQKTLLMSRLVTVNVGNALLNPEAAP